MPAAAPVWVEAGSVLVGAEPSSPLVVLKPTLVFKKMVLVDLLCCALPKLVVVIEVVGLVVVTLPLGWVGYEIMEVEARPGNLVSVSVMVTVFAVVVAVLVSVLLEVEVMLTAESEPE